MGTQRFRQLETFVKYHSQNIDDNTNPPPVPPKAARVLGLEEDYTPLPGIIHS